LSVKNVAKYINIKLHNLVLYQGVKKIKNNLTSEAAVLTKFVSKHSAASFKVLSEIFLSALFRDAVAIIPMYDLSKSNNASMPTASLADTKFKAHVLCAFTNTLLQISRNAN
jgi:hypothetical protein